MDTQITMRVETSGNQCDHLSLLIDNNYVGIQFITIVLYTKIIIITDLQEWVY